MVLAIIFFGDCIPPNNSHISISNPNYVDADYICTWIGVIFALFTPFFKDLKEVIPILTQLWFLGNSNNLLKR